MLKNAMYFNVFIIFIMSIIIFIKAFNKKSNLNNLKILSKIFAIYNFISVCLCYSEIVDIGWNLLIIFPVFVISLIGFIISFIYINIKLKKLDDNASSNTNYKKIIILLLLPIIIFLVPYMFELYIINNCNYLLEYNYQNGWIESDDTYIAIINDRPVSITLQKNLFNRKSDFIIDDYNSFDYYQIFYGVDEKSISISAWNKLTRDYEYIEDENIEKIALNAKKICESAKGAQLTYLPEKNYAIVTLTSEKSSGTILGEYFYHNNEYIQNIHTHGNLKSINYYK